MKLAILISALICLSIDVNAASRDKPPLKCVKGGCSGTLCVKEGDEVVSTCEWKDEYACFQEATCKEQFFGRCGWVQDSKLKQCLKEKRGETQSTEGTTQTGSGKPQGDKPSGKPQGDKPQGGSGKPQSGKPQNGSGDSSTSSNISNP
jgi:eight-cysteine-cluster-containing protein